MIFSWVMRNYMSLYTSLIIVGTRLSVILCTHLKWLYCWIYNIYCSSRSPRCCHGLLIDIHNCNSLSFYSHVPRRLLWDTFGKPTSRPIEISTIKRARFAQWSFSIFYRYIFIRSRGVDKNATWSIQENSMCFRLSSPATILYLVSSWRKYTFILTATLLLPPILCCSLSWQLYGDILWFIFWFCRILISRLLSVWCANGIVYTDSKLIMISYSILLSKTVNLARILETSVIP